MCLRSSQSASSTSCSLRCRVRSCVRNRFLASCWVSVEPPCETPRCRTLATAARSDADRIDAVMRIEAAVLDGDEGLRQIGRQVLQRDIGAGHFAARRQHAAVEADDLDGRRPFRNFQRLDRRQMRADPDHDADQRRSPPTGRAPRPNRTAGDRRTRARRWICACCRFGSARGFRSRGGHRRHRHRRPCAWRMIFSAGSSSATGTRSCGLRRNSRKRCGEPE